MPREMTYDSKCLELAKAFLGDCSVPDDKRKNLEDRLAKVIQRAIEDFIEDAVPEANRP